MYAHGQVPGDEAEVYATNTSRVPVFELCPSDRTEYPHFFERVEAECMEEILEPGDLLFMPPGWWHAMRGEGDSVAWSVSIWF
jgi:ribosomal protein L16 Arg81 hydroxylase